MLRLILVNLLIHRYNMLVKRGFWMKKEDLIKLKEKIKKFIFEKNGIGRIIWSNDRAS